MAFSGNYMVTSFKKELLQGIHTFGTDTFKIALYTSSAIGTDFGGSSATVDATVTTYSTNNEVPASGTYAAGGGTLTVVGPNQGSTVGYVSFSNVNFTSSSITARGAIIYNETESNKIVAVLDFGSDKSSSAGDFEIVFPANDSSNAIIRIQ